MIPYDLYTCSVHRYRHVQLHRVYSSIHRSDFPPLKMLVCTQKGVNCVYVDLCISIDIVGQDFYFLLLLLCLSRIYAGNFYCFILLETLFCYKCSLWKKLHWSFCIGIEIIKSKSLFSSVITTVQILSRDIAIFSYRFYFTIVLFEKNIYIDRTAWRISLWQLFKRFFFNKYFYCFVKYLINHF